MQTWGNVMLNKNFYLEKLERAVIRTVTWAFPNKVIKKQFRFAS